MNKTKYEDKRLSQLTIAQCRTLDELKLTGVGLAITGVLKAMSRKRVYLIDRRGKIAFAAKRGRYEDC
jgi:hypothetical protein